MKQRRGAGLGLAVLAAAAFGSAGALAASLLEAGWTPGAAVAARLVVAALVLTPIALVALRRHSGSLRGDARMLTIYGVVAVAGAQIAFFNAVQHLSVAIALLLEYSGTLMVVAWFWLVRSERPRALTIVGAVVAIGGLALVLDIAGESEISVVGVLWALAAAVGLATYFVLSADADDALPPLVVAWGGLVIGGVTILAAGLIGLVSLKAPRTAVVLLGTEMSWLVPVLGLSLVAGVLAYVSGITAARVLGARVASFVGLTEVLFAVLFAWLLLDQALTLLQGVGFVIVLVGIALVRIDEPAAAVVVPDPIPDEPALASQPSRL